MGLHDRLAARAAGDGKLASDMHRLAQSHANATWVCFVAAGAVWWFDDWQWALPLAILGVFAGLRSMSSTTVASRLELLEETVPPEPSNGGVAELAQLMKREDFTALQEAANHAKRRVEEAQDDAEREHWRKVMAEYARQMARMIASKQ